MVVCNLFEVILSVSGNENPIVDYLIYTDLPAGTQVLMSCRRTYRDRHANDSLWIGESERLTLVSQVQDGYCGWRGKINVETSDKKALEHFRQLNSVYSPSGISTPVSETLTITFMVGGRQRLKEFGGANNAELSGDFVSDCGGIKVVEDSRSVRIPMKSTFQSILATW